MDILRKIKEATDKGDIKLSSVGNTFTLKHNGKMFVGTDLRTLFYDLYYEVKRDGKKKRDN